MGAKSPKKGKAFELRAKEILDSLKSDYPDFVRLRYQPELTLNDGQVVRPDFDFAYKLPHAWTYHLIECQNRKRSSPTIAQKIRYMKATSPRNKFIFLYARALPETTRKALESDGVMHMSFREFKAFIARIRVLVKLLAAAEHANASPEEARRECGLTDAVNYALRMQRQYSYERIERAAE